MSGTEGAAGEPSSSELQSSTTDATTRDGESCSFDFDAFVNTSSEKELDALFPDRFSTDDPEYVKVADGFPEPIALYPWHSGRTFAYGTVEQRPDCFRKRRTESNQDDRGSKYWRSDRGDSVFRNHGYGNNRGQREPGDRHEQWQRPNDWRNNRKRRNPDMDRDRQYYPPHH